MKLNQSITTHSQSTPLHSDSCDSCTRCQGLLVHVDYMDMLQGGYLWGNGQRCINCGWIVDQRIQTNQQTRRHASTSSKRKARRTLKPIAA